MRDCGPNVYFTAIVWPPEKGVLAIPVMSERERNPRVWERSIATYILSASFKKTQPYLVIYIHVQYTIDTMNIQISEKHTVHKA